MQRSGVDTIKCHTRPRIPIGYNYLCFLPLLKFFILFLYSDFNLGVHFMRPQQGGVCAPSIPEKNALISQIPENIFLYSLKLFCLAPQIPKSSSASRQIPKNISQFSLKLKSHTFKTMKLYKSALNILPYI